MLHPSIKNNPQFWNYLKNNPDVLEDLLLNPEHLEISKYQYHQKKNEHFISKLHNISMLLRLMEMTGNE